MSVSAVRLFSLTIAFAVVAGNLAGVEEKKKEKKKKLPAIAADIVKVEIYWIPAGNGDDNEPPEKEPVWTTSEDEKKIAEMLAFFPELGQNSSNIGNDWVASYDITCLRKNGACFPIRVRISSDLNCWSGVGRGDWRLKDPNKFKKLMDSFGAKEKKKDEKKARFVYGGDVLPKTVIADIVKVEIQRAPNRKKGRRRKQSVTIEDKKKIAELLAYFPEIDQKSKHNGLWVADYHIKCTRKADYPLYIRVSWDLKWWSISHLAFGDWRLKNPDKFEKLIDDWIKKK